MMKPGRMYKNGHGCCGGCRVIVDAVQGGRQLRKARGWTHTSGLGWTCQVCSRWAADPRARVLEPTPKSLHLQAAHGEARGFGLRSRWLDLRSFLKLERKRRRKARRRARRAENRRSGHPSDHVETADMSPSAYRRWKKGRRRRE